MESGEILSDTGVSGFNGSGVLFGRDVLSFWQYFAIDRIIIGMEDGVLIPRDMRHQFSESSGRAITNS